jgi:hypothetical protein
MSSVADFRFITGFIVSTTIFAPGFSWAQAQTLPPCATCEARAASSLLPDMPLPPAAEGDGGNKIRVTHASLPFRIELAPKYAAAIEPDRQARSLGAAGKIVFAGSAILSIKFPITVIAAAGLSHGLDTDPKYGTNREAFAKRVGAAGARQASQIVFSDVVLAPLFEEDPRYYVMGSHHRTLYRIAYAATRVLVTRTDRGSRTINFAALGGYGGSAALTQLYYPARSRSRETMFDTFGTSLAGFAIDNEIREFFRFLIPGERDEKQ